MNVRRSEDGGAGAVRGIMKECAVRRFGVLATLLVFVAIIAASCGGTGGEGGGEDFPERNITWIVPFAAGGGTDTYARQIAPIMAEELGVEVAIRNVEGAASLRGLQQAAQAEPDGYTITSFNPPSSTISQLAEGEDAGVDLRDFTYLGIIGSTSYVAFAGAGFPADDLETAIDLYNSGEASVLAGQGRGGPVELLAVLMKNRYEWGWERYVGYDGGGDVVAAVLRGEAPVGIATTTAAQSNIESGDLKPLAVLQNTQSSVLPEAEPAVEQGLPDLDFAARLVRVVAAPPDMPEERQQKLEDALRAAVTAERTQEWSEETGNPVEWGDSEAAREATEESFRVQEEVPNIQEIIGSGG